MDLKKTSLSAEKLEELQQLSNIARGAILKMTTLSASGHPGGSMSSIDFVMMRLNMANIDPKKPKWEEKDRVIISYGHISPGVY